MIDNGSSRSPDRIFVFLHYCAHTGHVPTAEPRNKAFRGLDNETRTSLERTKIRLPIGTELRLDYPVELMGSGSTYRFWLGTSQTLKLRFP